MIDKQTDKQLDRQHTDRQKITKTEIRRDRDLAIFSSTP